MDVGVIGNVDTAAKPQCTVAKMVFAGWTLLGCGMDFAGGATVITDFAGYNWKFQGDVGCICRGVGKKNGGEDWGVGK